MRKETSKIMNAFYRGKPARAARTHTDGQTVWLHNNRIAWRTDDGDICFTLAGWGTVTTRERINGLLKICGYPYWGISQRNHEQWLVYHAEKVVGFDPYDVYTLTELEDMEKELT